MWARVAVGAALIIAVSAARPAGAQEGTAAAARLVLLEPISQALFDRISGQTSDLPWVLTRAAASGAGDRLSRASNAAIEWGARAVAWVERDSSSAFVLRVYDPQRKRLVVRRFALEGGRGTLAESAAVEALALSLRSILRALTADEPVGEAVTGSSDGETNGTSAGQATPSKAATTAASEASTHARTQKTASEAATKTPDASSARTEEPRPEEPDEPDDDARAGPRNGPRIALILAAAWDLALDGQSPLQQGPLLRPGVAIGAVELGAQLETGLEAKWSDTQTHVTLQRRAALLDAKLTLWQRSRFAFALGIAAGAASFVRVTTGVGPGLAATQDGDSLALALGFGARARIALLSGRRASLGLELEAGAWVVPAAPVLRYRSSNGQIDHALWPVQPHLHLGPYLRLEL